MELVKQEEECGCVVACLAMVLGKTYWEIREEWANDFTTRGVPFDKMLDYLSDHGHSIVHTKVYSFCHKDFYRNELFKPFAPIHIVHVTHAPDVEHSHVIVMDETGVIFDPAEGNEVKEKCYQVLEVVGIFSHVSESVNQDTAKGKRTVKGRAKAKGAARKRAR